jgi:guanylate kinase
MARAITCTTRRPRPGEREGVDYYFLEPAIFEKRVRAGDFLEHATVHGNSYGTLKEEVMRRLGEGNEVLLNIDVQGAASIRAEAGNNQPELKRALVTVFLTPPSLAILEQRLSRRGTEPPDIIAKRLAGAREEIAHWREFDYLLISTSISEDLRRMIEIVEAEAMRSHRVQALEL